MANSYTVSNAAYAKMVLHCAKYPWREVCGIWLGKQTAPGEGTEKRFLAIDAVPLFHSDALAPMLEVA